MPKTIDHVSGSSLPKQWNADPEGTYIVTLQERSEAPLSKRQLEKDFEKAYGSMGNGRRTDDVLRSLRNK